MANIRAQSSYLTTLKTIKERVYQAQYAALKVVNKELIRLYWDIGKTIVQRQESDGWGKSTVEQLASDLRVEFPGIKGFTERNVWRMRKFYIEYQGQEKLTQLVSEIGWSHHVEIFQRVKDRNAREYYISRCAQYSWSRGFLVDKIKSQDYERSLAGQTNFEESVDARFKTRAMLEVKDEYNFEFIALPNQLAEQELEEALVDNIVKFLAEMGGEFCFVGRQYRILIEDETHQDECYIDLLFYHRKLKSLVAIDLKVGHFKFEHAGKMAGYLAALDAQVKHTDESPSIGIIICRDKNKTRVKYALDTMKAPMGVATFSYKELPAKISKFLPSEAELEKRLLLQ